ncbi:hypothetical protein OG2516_13961 [Oceanicola granulosus HTCC2516]|uniref:L,D-TPase catalytic domain-containing protein n=1 Tax=Oceanicola granulosus (strain ATCC BAA-861 / DSM 15982 / KCTC 12143 / HTCC2516) TaxID=314256 RepID=Q2CA44_OCEGH|nr:hypothetical protein OG2516_13961 [Oceanicola granulosus HTCC2516]
MPSRRQFLAAASAFAALPAALRAHEFDSGDLATLPPELAPMRVRMLTDLPVGEIHVVPDTYTLYWTTAPGEAIRYFVGVGRDSLYESGIFNVGAKKEWPSWTPTPGMIEREPEKYQQYADGMPGGPGNPLGARALYLFQPERGDTYLRIHGTDKPETIKQDVSNGCARLVDRQIIELYDRVPLDTKVYLYEKDILPPVEVGEELGPALPPSEEPLLVEAEAAPESEAIVEAEGGGGEEDPLARRLNEVLNQLESD